ncbi:hypothetical protein GCM10023322_28000 [Rugosimonospora acidiphila]|uniref:Uncharacterized protein n=1 Tax=Rugosimonospora acidiphila TaxID=556531 RepID=A0ABP9RQV8_9ACTN
MADQNDAEIRVDYEFIKTNAQFWKAQVNSEHADIQRSSGQFVLTGGTSGVMPRLFTLHDQAIQFFRQASAEGRTATYHIAQRLELIQKWYEQNQQMSRALLNTVTGGVPSPNAPVAPQANPVAPTAPVAPPAAPQNRPSGP